MNPFLLTRSLHLLQGQCSAVPVLIFVSNSLRDAEFFSEIGDHNWGSREERLSEP